MACGVSKYETEGCRAGGCSAKMIHLYKKLVWDCCLIRAHELPESRGGRPGLPVPNSKDVAAEVLHYVPQKPQAYQGREPRDGPPRLSHSS